MAHFFTSCHGNRGKATRLGAASSGASTEAAGWKGCIEVNVWHNKDKDRDEFEVRLVPWGGAGGQARVIASGILNSEIEDPFIPALIA